MTYELNIEQDTSPINPRDKDWTDCNLGKMICFHSRYFLGDKHDYSQKDYNSWEELEIQLERDFKTGIIIPLYLYDHGGITMSTTPFSCRWDSGQVGFIVCDREQVKKVMGWKRITLKRAEVLEAYLRNEVKTYDQYLRGDIYGYCITDEEDNSIESCWGYYCKDVAQKDGESMLECLQTK